MRNMYRKLALIVIYCFVLTSCLSKTKKNEIFVDKDGNKIYNLGFFKESSIIIPKNQSEAQSLSIVVKNEKGELIVFDGGRAEDAGYLKNIIINNGGVVKAWFLTHIHDDHIGALYKILSEKDFSISIKNLYYCFADFEWYYEKIADDAGALLLFEKALLDYNKEVEKINYSQVININNSLTKGEVFDFYNVKIEVLNSIYKLESDPINNTSICYNVKIDDHPMIIYGDLGSKGGDKLLEETSPSKLKADIIVLSHHGQNGVGESVYYYANPIVVVWPTTRKIYENKDNKYDTDKTKEVLSNLSIKYNIFTYEETSIIK